VGLRRELTLLDATFVTIGGIIGSGIFFVPSRVAAQFPDPRTIMGLWVLGGLVSLAGALSVAELAAAKPRAGGPYVFVRDAFGPVAGFVAGWSYFLLGKAAIAAAVLLVFSQHVAYFLPLSPLGQQLLAVWAAASLTFVNWLGVKQGAHVNNLFTALKVGGLAVLVGAAFLLAPAAPPQASAVGQGSLSTALLLVLFAYNAWINATFLGEEVKDPGRNLPRALAYGTLGVMALYLLANLAYLQALGPGGMASSTLVATDTMNRAFAFGGAFIAAVIVASTYGNTNGGVLTGARIPLAMAQRGELPAALARLNAKGVPGAALWAQFGLTALLLMTGTFQAAATLGIFATWGILALVGLAVFVERRRAPDAPRPYRVPFYPWVPAAFVVGALFVVGVRVWEAPDQALLALGLMLAGLPLLAWMRWHGKRHDLDAPAAHDGAVPVGDLRPGP
jgi:basic amino acid/polyamine antiporter, APA family